MFHFVIPVLLLAARVRSIEFSMFHPVQSAASEAQIRFAIENKYDDTGPGAKRQEYAYDTYKTLEDALVGYVNDPDTKLPEQEKAKGVQNLYKNLYKDYNYRTPVQPLPSYGKNVLYNFGVNLPVFRPSEQRERLNLNQTPPALSGRLELDFVSDVDKQREDPSNVQTYQTPTSPPGQEVFSFTSDVEKQRTDLFKAQNYQTLPSPTGKEEYVFTSDVEKQRPDLFRAQKYQLLPPPPGKEKFVFTPDLEKQRPDLFEVQNYQTLPFPPGTEDIGLAPPMEKQREDPIKIQKYQSYLSPSAREEFGYVPEVEKQRADQFKRQKYHSVKGNPLNLAHFKRDQAIGAKDFDPNPAYSFSYGVHDKMTGDSKSAHESRDGDKVTGFYTFMDADGKQRSVHYTADDKQGFRAVVRRTAINSQ